MKVYVVFMFPIVYYNDFFGRAALKNLVVPIKHKKMKTDHICS